MESVRVDAFWSYLPACLAVAEMQHVRKAAQQLHISPSALSRTITLLEHRLGYPLFDRSGRRIQLNAAGEALLAAVRRGIELVDQVVLRERSPGAHGLSNFGPPRPVAASA